MSACSEFRYEGGISADSSRLTSNVSFAGFGMKVIVYLNFLLSDCYYKFSYVSKCSTSGDSLMLAPFSFISSLTTVHYS